MREADYYKYIGGDSMTFNPQDHLIDIKNRNGSAIYLPVQWRLVWFREQCPEGTIETEMMHFDPDRETEEEGYSWNQETRRSEKIVKRANGFVVFRAIVTDGKGGKATATKSEKAASFPDYIEKCETGSIGRALAMLGFGTQFTGDEFDEMPRIADAPVEHVQAPSHPQNTSRPGTPTNRTASVLSATTASNNDNMATDQQIASLRKLRVALNLPEMSAEVIEKMTFQDAKDAVRSLSHEYNESKQQKKVS
jgi:hypothetical protein